MLASHRWMAVVPLLLAAACGEPVTERNPGFVPPERSTRNGVPMLQYSGAPARLLLHEGVAPNPRFLFSGAYSVGRNARQQAVIAPDGDKILIFDDRGRYLRSIGAMALTRPVAVSPMDRGWMISERDGSLLAMDSTGQVQPLLGGPLPGGLGVNSGEQILVSRSPFSLSARPLPEGSPLVVAFTRSGEAAGYADSVIPAPSASATAVYNAGHLAATDSLFWFTFLTRDEIRSYDARMQPLWVSRRGIPVAEIVPTIELNEQGASLDYRPLNIGSSLLDGSLYVMSIADSTGETLRLDRMDAATGELEASGEFDGSRAVLVTVDRRGGVWLAPLDTLSALSDGRARIELEDFALPDFDGDTVAVSDFRGRVLLVNFWASWCEPCRAEFPAMRQLQAELADSGFSILAVNEDVDRNAALQFMQEFPSNFPIVVGGGRMQQRVRYRGLPFSLLLDRQGRVVQKLFGFAGAAQYERLREAVVQALAESGG